MEIVTKPMESGRCREDGGDNMCVDADDSLPGGGKKCQDNDDDNELFLHCGAELIGLGPS